MKLIQIKDYLLLIDEEAEIKTGNYYLYFELGEYKVLRSTIQHKTKSTGKVYSDKANKIIAYYHLTKEVKDLDLPLLTNPFEVGDFEKMVNKEASMYVEKYASYKYESYMYNECKRIFKAGYNAAQSKQFSLEDIKKAFEEGWKSKASMVGNRVKDKEAFIQSLSTQQLPKEFVPEYRYYYQSSKEFYSDAGFVECSKEQYESIKIEIPTCPLKVEIKTITNSEGKEELIGTYKY